MREEGMPLVSRRELKMGSTMNLAKHNSEIAAKSGEKEKQKTDVI